MRIVARLILCAAALLSSPAAIGQGGGPAGPSPLEQNPLEALEGAIVRVVDGVRPSVVQVTVRRTFEVRAPGPDGEERRATDAVATSGIVWSEDGHIVSLGRAFASAEAIEVSLGSGEVRPAALLGTDDETGLALLKIDPANLKSPLRPAPLGTSKRLRPGSLIVSISNPFGLQGSAVLGLVAGRDRVVRRGRLALTDVLQITTPVNPGDPGGALADARGHVVGVIASTYERPSIDAEGLLRAYQFVKRNLGDAPLARAAIEAIEQAAAEAFGPGGGRAFEAEARFAGALAPGGQGIGSAIPIDQARAVVERLKSEGKVDRAWLGVQVIALDPIVQAQLDLPGEKGVVVVGVVDGSPAAKGGLEQFDVVLRFGGRDVSDLREFKRLVLDTPPGKAVVIEVLRKGERKALEVVPAVRAPLGPAPEAPRQGPPK